MSTSVNADLHICTHTDMLHDACALRATNVQHYCPKYSFHTNLHDSALRNLKSVRSMPCFGHSLAWNLRLFSEASYGASFRSSFHIIKNIILCEDLIQKSFHLPLSLIPGPGRNPLQSHTAMQSGGYQTNQSYTYQSPQEYHGSC